MLPRTVPGDGGARLVLTCEHASPVLPPEYDGLGLAPEHLTDHIGWDIGAADLTEEIGSLLAAPAVLSAVSRLLVDCNRALTDHDLMPVESHGIAVPGNACLGAEERAVRLSRFYEPYHRAIDQALVAHPRALLLSVHSFTPVLRGRERRFDIGVLFDDFLDLAHGLAADLAGVGFAVRTNEPYSGLDGLIFSARSHGRRHGRRYVELEVNNRLLRSDRDVSAIAGRLAVAIAAMTTEAPAAGSTADRR